MTQAFDAGMLREIVKGPGVDTRQWCSYGIVVDDNPNAHSVRFNSEDGGALPQGVIVDVRLEPSGIVVPCRVGMHAAGSGEASYSPFGPGDEVFVMIPEGDERAGCVIVCRLTNAKDVYPTTVAGMDTTNNSVTFHRIKTPYIMETGATLMLRSALTNSQLAMDAGGGVFLSSGDKHVLALTADAVMLQTGDGSVSVQMDPNAGTCAITAGSTSFVVDPSASTFTTSGSLAIGTTLLPANQHAVTTEQVINLIFNTVCYLASTSAFKAGSPFDGSLWPVPGTAEAALIAMAAAVIPAAAAGALPIGTAGAPGGNLASLALDVLLPAAFVTQMATPDITGVLGAIIPGVGKPGLMF
jgi:hypothetical protein